MTWKVRLELVFEVLVDLVKDRAHQLVVLSLSLSLSLSGGSLLCTDYGFEYSDDEAQEEDVDIENQYYNSKGARRLRPCAQALKMRILCPPEIYLQSGLQA